MEDKMVFMDNFQFKYLFLYVICVSYINDDRSEIC